MSISYNKPTWADDTAPSINAERLNAISTALNALINQEGNRAIVNIIFDKSQKILTLVYADGNIETVENPIAGPEGKQGKPGEPGTKPVSLSLKSKIGTKRVYTWVFSDGSSYDYEVEDGPSGPGTGDMLREIYDTDNDGVVEFARTLVSQDDLYQFNAEDIADAKADIANNTDAIDTITERLSESEDWLKSKNILPYPFTYPVGNEVSGVHGGITYTDNGDGSLTLNGTSTGFGWIVLNLGGKLFGDIIGSDISADGGQLEVGDYEFIFSETNDNRIRTVYSPSGDSLGLSVIGAGKTFNNETFYPRVVRNDLADKSFTPYSKSNVNLNKELSHITTKLSENKEFLKGNLFDVNALKHGILNDIFYIVMGGYGDAELPREFIKKGTYTLSYKGNTTASLYIYSQNLGARIVSGTNKNPYTFTISNDDYVSIWLFDAERNARNITDVQLEEGSVATSYQKYAKSNIQLTEDLSQLLVVESFESETSALAVGGIKTFSVSATKDGYKPIGIVGWIVKASYNEKCNVYQFVLDGDTAKVVLINNHTATQNVSVLINVLMVKNI